MKSQEKDIQSHLQPLFPLRIPWFAGKASLLRPWSFGWFCKTKRYGKRTNAPKSSSCPLFHHPTLRPRKTYCKNLKEIKMWLLSEQCYFISSFPGLTAKSSCTFGCIKNCLDFILLVSIMIQFRAEKKWILILEDQIGKPALRDLSWEIVAASHGTNSNCTWDQKHWPLGSAISLTYCKPSLTPLAFSGPQFNISFLLKTSPSGVYGPKFKASETKERVSALPLLCCVILGKSHHVSQLHFWAATEWR